MKTVCLNALIFSFTTLLMLAIGEFVVRLIDSYALMSPELTRTLHFEGKPLPDSDENSSGQFLLEAFAASRHSSGSFDISWIKIDPPLRPKMDPPQELVKRTAEAQNGQKVNYLWNDFLVSEIFNGKKIRGNFPFTKPYFPDTVFVYPAPWKTMFPRYRYPSNVTLPSGIQTNQYGWRSKPIELKKNPRTIRVACVGASTTVSKHRYVFAYPDFLEHWLNLWKDHNGYNINFEVINAGREGINSTDIAAVVKYEVLPLDVDYVVYYEGSNQFNIRSMVNYPSDVKFGQPPVGLVPNISEISSADKTWLDSFAEYSALVARVRTVIESQIHSGVEPPKPVQTFFLPDGVDEWTPDLGKLGVALSLGVILKDLQEIKMEVEKTKAKMIMTTFKWLAFDGMVLDPVKHRGLFVYLNRKLWPISYENIERMASFQNRVFKKWSQENGLDLVELAEKIPQEPDLFSDPIHNTRLGVKIRSWLVFEGIIPILEQDLYNKTIPRIPQNSHDQHPFIKKGYTIQKPKSLNGLL